MNECGQLPSSGNRASREGGGPPVMVRAGEALSSENGDSGIGVCGSGPVGARVVEGVRYAVWRKEWVDYEDRKLCKEDIVIIDGIVENTTSSEEPLKEIFKKIGEKIFQNTR